MARKGSTVAEERSSGFFHGGRYVAKGNRSCVDAVQGNRSYVDAAESSRVDPEEWSEPHLNCRPFELLTVFSHFGVHV